MILDMYEYYQMINRLNLNIIYSGPIWADGIEGIAGTLKKRLELDEMPLSASQSVFSVFVEQMNNMLMYSAEKERFNTSEEKDLDVSRGTFVLGMKDKTYFVQSGNIIENESIDRIRDKIDYLNTLNKTELRKYYKEQMKSENTNPKSKGAGLGLIEIARRATSKIEYEFKPLEDDVSFFTMFVTIAQGGM